MHPALWSLMKLRWRASGRRFLRQAKTLRGALLLCVWLLIGFGWLGASLVSTLLGRAEELATARESARAVAPLVMFLLWLLLVVMPASGQAIAFHPAEVDFLFPAPFTRRELIAYKLTSSILSILFLSLVMSLVGRAGYRYWILAFLGLVLLIGGMQLSLIAVSLARQMMAERFFKFAHKLVLGAALLAAAVAANQAVANHGTGNLMKLAVAFSGSWTGRVLLAPFEVYARTITAERLFPDFIGWGAAALALNAMMAALIVRLDANYLEAAADASRKRYEAVQRAARGEWWGQRKVRVGWRLPAPRWLKGCGPLAWRQSLHLMRTSGGLVAGAIVLAGACVLAPVVYDTPQVRMISAGGASYLAFLCLFSAGILPFGLRADVDRLGYLKSLPLPAWAVVVGELTPAALLLSMIQTVLVGAAAVVQSQFLLALPLVAMFIPGVSLLCIACDNLLFLWYPYHSGQAGPGDMQAAGRQMVLMMLRIPMLAALAALAASAGGIAFVVCGQSLIAMALATWCAMWCEVALVLAGVARAFLKFDVSLDTPAQ